MNPFAFFPSENPLEWDEFLHEPTADLWCPNTNSPNILHFLVKVTVKTTEDASCGARGQSITERSSACEVHYLDRFFFLPHDWLTEQDCLKSELYTYDRQAGKGSLRRDHPITALCFESWENEYCLYTPVSMDYYH